MTDNSGRPVEIHFARLSDVNRDTLPFLSSLVFGELHTSEMLNAKDFGLKKQGIYTGLNPVASGGFNLTIECDSESGLSSAMITKGMQNITIIQQHNVVIEVPNGSKWNIVLAANYEYGVKTRQVDNDSEVDAAQVLMVSDADLKPEHLIICSVDLSDSPAELMSAHIDTSNRVMRFYDVDDHAKAEDPHPQYATEAESRQYANEQIGEVRTDNFSEADSDKLASQKALKDGLDDVSQTTETNLGDAIDTIMGPSPDVEANDFTKVKSQLDTKVDKDSISDSTSSSASNEVASSAAVKTVQDDVNTKVAKSSISSDVNSVSTSTVASSLAVKTVQDNANTKIAKTSISEDHNETDSERVVSSKALNEGLATKAEVSHTHEVVDLPYATTTEHGVVKLSNSTTSTSQSTVATSNAIKSVQDNANTKVSKDTEVMLGEGMGGSTDMSGPLVITPEFSSTSKRGIVQLIDSAISTAVDKAPTANAVKLVNDNANSRVLQSQMRDDHLATGNDTIPTSFALDAGLNTKSDNDHVHPAEDIPDATVAVKGVVKLSNSVTSSSQTLASTPLAVKTVQDNANSRVSKTDVSSSIDSVSMTTVASSKAANDLKVLAENNLVDAKLYTDAAVETLMGDTPKETLDTFSEIAAAFQDSDDAFASVNAEVAKKVDKTNISDSVISSSQTTVASSKAVKSAYDLASTKMTQSTGDSRYIRNFVMEDADGTEITVTQGKELKFVNGGNVNINFTDTTPGSDVDPFDLSFSVNNASTTVKGVVQLSTSTSSTSTTTAATSSAVKSAYSLAASKMTQATGDGRYLGISANAVTASAWVTARTLSLSGDAAGSVSISGAGNMTLAVTVANNSHTHTWANVTGKPSTYTPTTENVQDIVGAMVSSNTETNISATYVDSSGKLNFSVNSASTSTKGVVQLSGSVSSTSTTLAATPSAVKSAYDLAASKMTQATGDGRYLGISATAANASKLDNIDSSQFLRSDANDIKTAGYLRFNDNCYLNLGTGADVEHFWNGSNYYTDINGGANWYIRDGNSSNATRFTFDVDYGNFSVTGKLEGDTVHALSRLGVPDGTSDSGTKGDIRFNPSKEAFEGRGTTDWLELGGGSSDGGDGSSGLGVKRILGGYFGTFYFEGMDGNVYYMADSATTYQPYAHNAWSFAILPIDFTDSPLKQCHILQPTFLFLKENGDLIGYGYNGRGQMGLGSTTTVTTPTLVMSGVERIILSESSQSGTPDGVGAGYRTVVVEKKDGTYWGWGTNSYGMLGLGDRNNETSPVQILSPDGGSITNMWKMGNYFSRLFFTTSTGKLYAAGHNAYGNMGAGDSSSYVGNNFIEVDIPFDVTEIKSIQGTAGEYVNTGSYNTMHLATFILLNNGDLYVAGDDKLGLLGDGTTSSYIINFTKSSLPPLEDVIVGPSGSFQGIPKGDAPYNRYYAWGRNAQGNLGIGSISDYVREYQTVYIDYDKICRKPHVLDYIDYEHSFLINYSDNSVWTFGYNGKGELGVGTVSITTTPTRVLLFGEEIDDVFSLASTTSYSTISFFTTKSGRTYVTGQHNSVRWAGPITHDTTEDIYKIPHRYI